MNKTLKGCRKFLERNMLKGGIKNVEDDLKNLEASILRESATCGRMGVDELNAQRNRVTSALITSTGNDFLPEPEAIRDHLQEMLVLSVRLQCELCGEQQWRTGVAGAVLLGRISTLIEVLNWMGNGKS
jgi:hypothetical protein